jgi:hemerythrin-like domain-containing protein
MSNRDPKNPRVLLQEDHRQIELLLERLVATMRADDRETEAKAWDRAEKAILRHLDAEEMFVFPTLVDGHAKEVEALLREHAALRRQLGAIGLTIDLHTARAAAIEEFCATLRKHAEREESLVYTEAEKRLSVNISRAIFRRLGLVVPGRKREPRPRGASTRVAS